MPRERLVHIVDDEAEVLDALTLLLSTAGIESRSYGSAEEYLAWDYQEFRVRAAIMGRMEIPNVPTQRACYP